MQTKYSPAVIENGQWHPEAGKQLIGLPPEDGQSYARLRLPPGMEVNSIEVNGSYGYEHATHGVVRTLWETTNEGRLWIVRNHSAGTIVASISISEDGSVLDYTFTEPPAYSGEWVAIELQCKNQKVYCHLIDPMGSFADTPAHTEPSSTGNLSPESAAQDIITLHVLAKPMEALVNGQAQMVSHLTTDSHTLHAADHEPPQILQRGRYGDVDFGQFHEVTGVYLVNYTANPRATAQVDDSSPDSPITDTIRFKTADGIEHTIEVILHKTIESYIAAGDPIPWLSPLSPEQQQTALDSQAHPVPMDTLASDTELLSRLMEPMEVHALI